MKQQELELHAYRVLDDLLHVQPLHEVLCTLYAPLAILWTRNIEPVDTFGSRPLSVPILMSFRPRSIDGIVRRQGPAGFRVLKDPTQDLVLRPPCSLTFLRAARRSMGGKSCDRKFRFRRHRQNGLTSRPVGNRCTSVEYDHRCSY